MNELKRIYPKVALFLAIIVAISAIYKHIQFEADLHKYSPIIFNLRDIEHQAQVVYFGESSNISTHPSDSVKKRISQFAAEYYPDLNFTQVDNSAYHAAQYKTLLKNIPDDSSIETVIVTMNLRSFGANWVYSKLETSLQKSMVLLDTRYPPFVNRLRLSLKDYDIKSNDVRHKQVLQAWEKETFNFPYEFEFKNVNDWDWSVAMGGGTYNSLNLESYDRDIACHFIKNFAFTIDTLSHPRIKDYDEIVLLAKERGWNLVFNLLAENTERAQNLVGDELLWLLNHNRELLINRYNNDGVIVVDNLYDVTDSLFTDRHWPTEHYAEAGRRIIGRNVADSLRKFYPDYYKP